MELQSQEGPCLDAFRTQQAVQAGPVEAARRWPTFSQQAQSFGYLTVGAVPLRLRDQTIGALNLFRDTDVPIAPSEIRDAQALADVATIGLLNERAVREARLVADQLQHALNSRVIIEQAKGVLAVKLRCDVDAAFAALRSYARSHNRRLAEVAHEVISGEIAETAFPTR
jgi:hypothetical protein